MKRSNMASVIHEIRVHFYNVTLDMGTNEKTLLKVFKNLTCFSMC